MLLARGCMVDYLAKKFLPSNLLTQSGKNKDLMLWIRCWQWRYEHGSDDLLKATGQKLKNFWAQQKNGETSCGDVCLPRVQFQEPHNIKHSDLAFRERGIYSILTKFYQFSVHFFGHISHFSMTLQKALLYGNHNEFATCPNGKCENARAVFNPAGMYLLYFDVLLPCKMGCLQWYPVFSVYRILTKAVDLWIWADSFQVPNNTLNWVLFDCHYGMGIHLGYLFVFLGVWKGRHTARRQGTVWLRRSLAV